MLFQGCPAKDIIVEIQGYSGVAGTRSQIACDSLSDHAVSTIWKWLVARSDVSVGPGRKYNELSLQKLLQSSNAVAHGSDSNDERAAVVCRHTRIESASENPAPIESSATNVFVSEDTMWELITGHTVNYKRVPGLEWHLLLGIASTKSQGILQGDLGRLVGQDKRSVPKRTDSLLKKGYIVKRTTLVRGTKTSKLWLKSFAPPLTQEGDNQKLECEEQMNITPQALTANLDQVPWHTRWTGESMDFHALATTIMAVTKEWHVIRLQDLKAKLGVLGLRWQMKIVSKICRFLNSCGAIQYVAAKLDNKVYKDCIKFNRSLSTKDWSAFLATGKRSAKPARPDPEWQADLSQVNGSRLRECHPWTVDEPLPQKIIECAQYFGVTGVTNPEIYVLTLGPTFNRYVSSLTSCMANSNVQPPELANLQLISEHIRVGKVASYKFCTPHASQMGMPAEMQESLKVSRTRIYSFSTVLCNLGLSGTDATLSEICGLVKSRSTGHHEARTRGRRRELPQSTSKLSEFEFASSSPQTIKRTDDFLITLRVSTEALRNVMSFREPIQNNLSSAVQQLSEQVPRAQTSRLNYPVDTSDNSHHEMRSASVRRGSRGRPVQSNTNMDVSLCRPWTCEKCGGSWKNDLGLKYHLEKSKTPCNPRYHFPDQGMGRKSRCSTYRSRQTEDNVSTDFADRPLETRRPTLTSNFEQMVVASPESNAPCHIAEDHLSDIILSTEQHPMAGKVDSDTTVSSLAVGIVKSRRRFVTVFDESAKYSPSRVDQGLLCPRDTERQGQGLISRTRSRPVIGGNGAQLPFGSVGHSLVLSSPSLPTASLCIQDALKRQENTEPIDFTTNQVDTRDQLLETNYKTESVTIPKRNPGPNKAKTTTSHSELRLLIQRLLSEQHGVILGGQPLWDSILTLWGREAIGKATPVEAQCQSALNSLLKDGIIVEHWHAFRESSGSFTKSQLLTSPGVDVFSSQSLRLLEKLKRPLPSRGEIITCDSDKKADLLEIKVGGRGRRALAKEVATLRAPVYAAQVAAKKDQESGTRDRVKRQRQEGASDEVEDVTYAVPAKRRQIYRAHSIGSQPDFLESQDKSLQNLRGIPQALKLRFLEPNNFLGQYTPDIEFLQDLSSDQAQITGQDNAQQESTLDEGIAVKLPERIGDGVGKVIQHSPVTVLCGSNGSWPSLDSQYFEHTGGSFAIEGWMPDTQWFGWESFSQDLEKEIGSVESTSGSAECSGLERHRRFMDQVRACFEMEMGPPASPVNARRPAGPHNIFVRLNSGIVNTETGPFENGQLNWASGEITTPAMESTLSSSDDEVDWATYSSSGSAHLHAYPADPAETASHVKAKRVALVTRALTSLPDLQGQVTVNDDVEQDEYPFDSPDELIAAFTAIRTLVGGAEKSIDWGLLMLVFPNASLQHLRRFWDLCRKQQGPLISTLTRSFQERYLTAVDRGDVPMINFDNPRDYDWAGLIRWTVDLPRQEGFEIPRLRTLFNGRFSLTDSKTIADDWRERFFHVQASIFARFEAVTSSPAALSITDRRSDEPLQISRVDEVHIARSWVKSLCVTRDGKYSVENIKDKFFTLSPGNKRTISILFKEAVDQLTKQRIICKSKKPPLGGRPYRLNEGYLAMLAKLAHTSKYDDAARFKMKLDVAFRKRRRMTIPYSFGDGAMMALTNLSAAGRINLVPTNLPNIPYGFEPGNYESRKYPKSYYHFSLDAVPTDLYLFNEQIDVVRTARANPPPRAGRCGELPQWVDIFGEPNACKARRDSSDMNM
ncbi:hypothetical protein E4U56_003125 [Claviceps arundinis]|uniref:B-block binding subunit of TFIIIC domain-containing protein n=1 Tax=Claviceps arundinis TaxID=1623583 RepID=A0A9P7MPY1_9HYPO|nr:hypothetical protein E4U56_003125 [Claviceps arundinis]